MLKGNEKLNIQIVKDTLKPVFKNYNLKKVVLFGSVAKNTNRIDSDIDLLVDSGLKGLEFLGLVESIRETINKDVDIFDVMHIDNGSLIDKEIRKSGVVIYDQN